MPLLKYPTDRTIDSTDTNEYADGMRDETLWERDLMDTETPITDEIPDGVDELGEDDRPSYDEQNYENNPGS